MYGHIFRKVSTLYSNTLSLRIEILVSYIAICGKRFLSVGTCMEYIHIMEFMTHQLKVVIPTLNTLHGQFQMTFFMLRMAPTCPLTLNRMAPNMAVTSSFKQIQRISGLLSQGCRACVFNLPVLFLLQLERFCVQW